MPSPAKRATLPGSWYGTIMITIYQGDASSMELSIDYLDKSKVLVHHYRVDRAFSNSFEKWKSMVSSQNINELQYKELEQSGLLQLFTSPEWKKVENEKAILKFDLPRQAVSLVQLTW